MLILSNPRHEKFAQALANGASASAAYRKRSQVVGTSFAAESMSEFGGKAEVVRREDEVRC
jgi:hypothetical protein